MELFKDIEAAFVPGQWCTLEKSLTLASLIVGLRPAVTLEIGVFAGGSFLPMAMAHKAINHGVAIGVDAWDKTVAVAAQVSEADRAWWNALDMESVYQGFMGQIRQRQLEGWTKIARRKSRDFDIPPAIGLAHVDGAHNDEAITDVVRIAGHVELGGFVVMDDLNWQGGGPSRAAQRLVQMGYKHLYPLGTGAVFQRQR